MRVDNLKSFYAVAGQLMLSSSNYVVFLLFTFLLTESDFIGFSTAVALNIMAYAVAEGGISYVAPREISKKSNTRAVLAGSFIAISISIYIAMIILGFCAWNLFSNDSLSLEWVSAYAIYFFPVLLIPSWLTCWSIDIVKLIVLSLIRGLSILFIYFYPTYGGVIVSGVIFTVFTIFFVKWLNTSNKIIKLPTAKSLQVAGQMIKEVFVSKTASYAVYAIIPLIVASIYGNRVSSLYVLGERVKSMYSTLFQPLIQTIYLSSTKKGNIILNRSLPYLIALLNVTLTIGLIIIISLGYIRYLGERFYAVTNLQYYVVAACLSILTACLLYFKVLPEGNYGIFRTATYFQIITFLILFFVMKFKILLPATVLLIGEFAILFSICFQLFIMPMLNRYTRKQGSL